jgi:tellurite resistance protein TehA-like permease
MVRAATGGAGRGGTLGPAGTRAVRWARSWLTVASLAWFALRGAGIDVVAEVFGGYGLLMILAQVRLLPAFLKLPFMPSTWAFTFSWAAVAVVGLIWLEALKPGGYRAWESLVLVAITLFIGEVAVRTAVALARHFGGGVRIRPGWRGTPRP